MWNIDISRFKVIHSNEVLNALCIAEIWMPEDMNRETRATKVKPVFLDVLAVNADGEIVSIHDEAWTFQFVPIIQAPITTGGVRRRTDNM